MKFTIFMLAVALTVAVPTAAHSQAAQAAGIAQAALGIAFGVMFPAPRCGPHDALPQPYQPRTPSYSPPPPPLDQHANLDEDDDDSRPLRPLPPRPSTYSLQPQTRPDAEDESDQTTNVRARDTDSSDQPVLSEDDPQPVQPRTKRRPVRPNRQAQTTEPAQSSGQVAEIPSLPRGAQRSGASRLNSEPVALIVRCLRGTSLSPDGDCRFLTLAPVDGLSPRGEAGAKRRVRVLSAWRHLLTPSIKILTRSAGKIAPRVKDSHPTLSQLGEGIQTLSSSRIALEFENSQSQKKARENCGVKL